MVTILTFNASIIHPIAKKSSSCQGQQRKLLATKSALKLKMAAETDNEIPDLPVTEAVEDEGGQVNEGQSESRVGSSKSTKVVNIPNLFHGLSEL